MLFTLETHLFRHSDSNYAQMTFVPIDTNRHFCQYRKTLRYILINKLVFLHPFSKTDYVVILYMHA